MTMTQEESPRSLTFPPFLRSLSLAVPELVEGSKGVPPLSSVRSLPSLSSVRSRHPPRSLSLSKS